MIPVVFVNSKKISYVDLIIDGKKKYETRHRNTLRSLVGRRILIAETGKGTPKIRCSAVLKSAEQIKTLGEWAMLRSETCVPEDSEHDWNFKRPGKWIYKLEDVREQIGLPWKEGKRHGIVWMEYEPAPYRMIYDGGSFIDGIDHDSFESAVADAQDTLIMWECEQQLDWKWDEETHRPILTDLQKESWDSMIEECECFVVGFNEETGEYDDIDRMLWPSTDKDTDELNWMFLEDLEKKWKE